MEASQESTNPWDRLPQETPGSYTAFITYRDLGALRTLKKGADRYYDREDTGAKPTQVKQFGEWSRTNAWVERAAAWDRFKLGERAKEREVAAREMNDRHGEAARIAFGKFLTGLKKLKVEELSPKELLSLMDASVKWERLARGEATANVGHAAGVDNMLERLRVDPNVLNLFNGETPNEGDPEVEAEGRYAQ